MVIAAISLENDGATIAREMSDAARDEQRAWNQAKRTLVELCLVNPADIDEVSTADSDRRSLVIGGRTVYQHRTERLPEKVCVYAEWRVVAELGRWSTR